VTESGAEPRVGQRQTRRGPKRAGVLPLVERRAASIARTPLSCDGSGEVSLGKCASWRILLAVECYLGRRRDLALRTDCRSGLRARAAVHNLSPDAA